MWGVGDLVIATPFLRAASEKFEVTLLAKAYAADLRPWLWPSIRTIPFNAPWTAFDRKYRFWSWHWGAMSHLAGQLRRHHFDVALSARWDPRDHLLLRISGAKARLGFPRTGSQMFLTRSMESPPALAHRTEHWRVLARALDFDWDDRTGFPPPRRPHAAKVLVHTGAGQPVRVWPLDRYRQLVAQLREAGHQVEVACNPEQRDWWLKAGEEEVATPVTISELLNLVAGAGVFIGNDSGPGHLAAAFDIPTFTFFGPQVPEWFVPLHPAAEWLEGKACPYKPCSDYCHFATPICLANLTVGEVIPVVERFVSRHLSRLTRAAG